MTEAERDTACVHPDIRHCPDRHGAIACFTCGRLFGHLNRIGHFNAFNPPMVLSTYRDPVPASSPEGPSA